MSRYKNAREHTTLQRKTNRGLVGRKILCLKLSAWSGLKFRLLSCILRYSVFKMQTWYAVIFLGFASGHFFNINAAACVMSSLSGGHVKQTESVPNPSPEVQSSSVLPAELSFEARSASFTSHSRHVETTKVQSVSSPEIKSSMICPSVTSGGEVTASASFSKDAANKCTEMLLEVKKLLEVCVLSSESRGHVQPTQSVSRIMNSSPSPQRSPLCSMIKPSIEAVSPSLTSTSPNIEATAQFSLITLTSSPENASPCITDSLTITSTRISPSTTISTDKTNCTKLADLKKQLREKIATLKGKTLEEIIEDFEGKEKMVYNDEEGKKRKVGNNKEGKKRKVGNDKKKRGGKKTVGIGFNMEQPDARKIWKKVLPDVPFDDVLSGKRGLEDKEIEKLFQHTLKIKTAEAKRLFPKYDTYPDDVKIALLNGVFRGDFEKGHNTVKLINKGEWSKVGDEYLNREDFENCIRDGLSGIWVRLRWNAYIFRKYALKLKSEKAKKKQ